MPTTSLRAVIDTNVVFEGLTQRSGVCGSIIDAWLNEGFSACISTALDYEYEDVLARKLSSARWSVIEPVLETLISLAEWVTINYSLRPAASDPGDDFIVDCAMNAGAVIVTRNVRDFRRAAQRLNFRVITPEQFLVELKSALPLL